MKALLRTTILVLLVFGIYAGISNAATSRPDRVNVGPTGMPRPQCPDPGIR